MAKIENHQNYNSIFFHLTKSDKIVYSLNQYVAEHKYETDDTGWITSEITEGSELSVMYHNYKYNSGICDVNKLCNIISELIKKESRSFGFCTILVPVPSEGQKFSNLCKKIATSIRVDYQDSLIKTNPKRLKMVDVNERSKLNDFVVCDSIFSDKAIILLLDDFVESGTTFRECEKAIKSVNPSVDIVKVAIFRTERTLAQLEG